MEGHVVWFSIPVGVSDVGDGADRHGNLAKCIDDGQVDDSPALRRKMMGFKWQF